jgi:hypothetical protein
MRSALSKRLYLALLSLAVITLLLLRLFAIPYWSSKSKVQLPAVAASVTDSLLGAAIASLIISTLILLILQPHAERQVPEAEVIAAKDVGPILKKAVADTNIWNYRGHTGRYFRTVILPALNAEAHRAGRYITICLQLLDPDDLDAVHFFVSFRADGTVGGADYWSVTRARAEIAATVLATCRATATSNRLERRIFLGRSMSPYTVDMSSRLAILSRAEQSALRYSAGSTFYQSALEDLRLGFRQARELKHAGELTHEIHSIDDVELALNQLNLLPDRNRALIDVVFNCLQNPINPYGR